MTKKKRGNFKQAVQKDVEKRRNEQNNYGYLKLPQGVGVFKATATERRERIHLDFIPYEVKMKNHPDSAAVEDAGGIWYKLPFKIHRDVGVNNDTVVCPTSFGKPCPICDYRKKIQREGADKEDYKPLFPKSRCLYNVIPIEHSEYDEEIHIWDMSNYLFQNLLDDEIEENPEDGDFPSVESGKTLKIRFDAQKIGKNEFCEASRIDFEEREEQYEDAIIDDAVCLDEMLEVHDYKTLESMFFDMEVDDADTTDEEFVEDDVAPELPKRKRKKLKGKVEKEEEPEDVEEENEDEDDVEEPGEKPKSRKRRKPKKEQESEQEEEEEEEEKPKKKPATKKKPAKKTKKDECPHGHTFGVDHEEHDECADCEKWDECFDASEED